MDAAASGYRQALALKPDLVEACHNLGLVLRAQGRREEAAAAFERALAIRPDLVETHVSLGLVRVDQGRLPDAAAVFEQALTLRADHDPARMNLGAVLHRLGRLEDAARVYRIVLTRHPSFADAHANLGAALKDLGDLDRAEASLARALAFRPDHAAAHYGLGGVLAARGRIAEAIESYERAIALRPEVPEAHASLAGLLQAQGRLDAAEAAYRRVVALSPGAAPAHLNLAMALQSQGRLPEAMAAFERAAELAPNDTVARDAWLCGLSYRPEITADLLLAEHQRWASALGPRPEPSYANDRDPDRRLRIGYVSGDFHHHPVGFFLASVLEAHDPAEVEVFCYANDRRSDAVTERLRAAAGAGAGVLAGLCRDHRPGGDRLSGHGPLDRASRRGGLVRRGAGSPSRDPVLLWRAAGCAAARAAAFAGPGPGHLRQFQQPGQAHPADREPLGPGAGRRSRRPPGAEMGVPGRPRGAATDRGAVR